MAEEIKWIKSSNPAGVPVWSHGGIVCTGETYKQVVKLTFARGASLPDPRRLFNASLEGNTRRAIDIREGETLDAPAFKALIRAAVAENLRFAAQKSRPAQKQAARSKPAARSTTKAAGPGTDPGAQKVVLLSGGNPQVAKGDGDAQCRLTSPQCPAGKAKSGNGSMHSSSAACRASARPSNGPPRSTASKAVAGSFRSTSSPDT